MAGKRNTLPVVEFIFSIGSLSNLHWHAAIVEAIATYIEKKHYHVSKKVTDFDFVWHSETLFQPNDISVAL